ncbi:MAG: ABC transporter substrate-binding protein [Syntrophomonadaceae bacterium]|jgi:peptide/nickel transport system substrate-binding protein/oligopeptide transport system substrate-binding protein|nr:ABC transporter substrate-binding protein [Syntrophomonadaceae bacterium]
MYITFRKVAIIGAIVGMLILTVALIYTHNLATYTASIDTRPFKAGLIGSVNSLDPALMTEHEEQLIASTLYEGLVYFDENSGNVKPLLAKSWKFSSDGKSLTIKLKQNVKFHNNQKLTAQKVKAAWEKSFSSCKELSKTSLILSVAGAADCLNGSQTTIAGIEAVNESTLKINFAVPDSSFPYKLCNPIFWVYDIQTETDTPQPGSGPFILTGNKDNKQILLIGNTNYHRGIPRLSAIDITVFADEVTAYQSYTEKKLDYLDRIPLSEIKKIKQNEQLSKLFIEKPLLEIYALGLNVNKEPFAGDYLLRRALNYAIDRNQIAEDVFGSGYVPIKGVIPTEVKGYSNEMPGYIFDPEKAKKLLEEAGYPEGTGLKTIILSYNNDEGHQMVAEAIANQLSPLGISIQLQPMEWEYYKKQMQQSAMTFFRVGWAADYPDADSFLYGLFHSSMAGKGNYTGYHNPQVDKILDAARAETKSNAERLKLLRRAEEIIVDDAPFIWLLQKKSAAMTGTQTHYLSVNRMGMIDWFAVELVKPEFSEENTSI